jgi:hypothetical protein
MGKMMELMMGKMSQEERRKMMEEMMGKFMAGMTAEDRQKMIENMMPKMMEGVDMMQMMPKMMTGMMGCGAGDAGMMDMMSKAGEGQRETEMSMMPKMMMEMMPKCLGMMLPRVPKEKRIDFVSTMITTLMQQGCAGMSEEEKGNFKAKVLGKF